MSSHLLAEVEAVCSWVILLDRGRRVHQGTIEDLQANGTGRLIVRTVDRRHLSIVEKVAAQHGYTADRDGARLVVRAPADFAGRLNAETMRRGAVVCELRTEMTSLEEQFFAFTDEALP